MIKNIVFIFLFSLIYTNGFAGDEGYFGLPDPLKRVGTGQQQGSSNSVFQPRPLPNDGCPAGTRRESGDGKFPSCVSITPSGTTRTAPVNRNPTRSAGTVEQGEFVIPEFSDLGEGQTNSEIEEAIGLKNTNPTAPPSDELEYINVTAERIVDEEMASACESAYKSAMIACKGETITNVIMPQVRAFDFASKSGNAKEACSSAKKLNELGLAATGAFTATCQYSQSKCTEACTIPEGYSESSYSENFDKNQKNCEQFSENWKASIAQSVEYAGQYMQSDQCEKMAGGDCDPANAETYDNASCINYYCMKPGRLNDPKCNALAQMCNDPNNRTQAACICYTNPNHPSCPNGKPPEPGTGGLPTTAGGSKPDKGFWDSLFGGDDAPGFFGNDDKDLAGGSPVNADGSAGGGSGGFGSGSGSQAGYNDGSGGGSGGGVDSKILTGYGRGASGGYVGGPSGSGSGSGSAGGGGHGNGVKELNLRDFLPGGSKDGRSIASPKSLGSRGISEAEGLSNWVKVSRKISQKRSTLLP